MSHLHLTRPYYLSHTHDLKLAPLCNGKDENDINKEYSKVHLVLIEGSMHVLTVCLGFSCPHVCHELPWYLSKK
jgi:hypothetical protein